MKAIVVEPQNRPVLRDIGPGLGSMQEIVGGSIEAVYPFDESVVLVCNEEGKLLGLPLNRALRDADGTVYDIISGMANRSMYVFTCWSVRPSNRSLAGGAAHTKNVPETKS